MSFVLQVVLRCLALINLMLHLLFPCSGFFWGCYNVGRFFSGVLDDWLPWEFFLA